MLPRAAGAPLFISLKEAESPALLLDLTQT
jgi:hypothetical protein